MWSFKLISQSKQTSTVLIVHQLRIINGLSLWLTESHRERCIYGECLKYKCLTTVLTIYNPSFIKVIDELI